MDMNKIKISDKHLSIIDQSLEAFARGRAGQFGILFEFLFPDLNYDQKTELENLIKSKLAEFGIENFNKSETDIEAWNIHKLFDEHLSVKRNGGWGETVNFNGPINKKGLPEIEGFSEWVEFIFPDEMQEEMNALFEGGDMEFNILRKKAGETFNVKYFSESEVFRKEKEEKFLTSNPKEYLVGVRYRKPILK